MNATVTPLTRRATGSAAFGFRPISTQHILALGLLALITTAGFAGIWSDDFSEKSLSLAWRGDRDYFSIMNGSLDGYSASPLAPVPLRWVEVGEGWDNYVVQCRLNVVTPNLLVCTKGALLLRHNGQEGYVFALHVATQTVEVYRLSNNEMLLLKETPLELQHWYQVRAEMQGDSMAFYLDDKLIGQISDNRSPAGAVGLAVQDTLLTLFDDFTVSGPNIPNSNPLTIGYSNNTLTLAWPTSLAVRQIQVTDSLTPPVTWTTITNVPVEAGNQEILLLDIASTNRFYRLIQ